MTKVRLKAVLTATALTGFGIAWWLTRAPDAPAPSVVPSTELDPAALPVSTASVPVPVSSLAERKQELLQMDPAEARDWILQELEIGKDYDTEADLTIGSDGNLSAWPSYCTYLLDLLHLVDPGTAADLSRKLVESSQSPDEWAVALRNVAVADNDDETREWLRAKSAALLRNTEWRSDPSAGYLNAFDVMVHTEYTALTPELLALSDDPDKRAVRHASFLVVDRLTQRRPDVVLPLLADSANRYPNSGRMISNLMARADLREDIQRESVERYLLDSRRTKEELDGFASVFPNANFLVSNNLLTPVDGLDGIELAERDRAALKVVESWLSEERFAKLRPVLQRSRERLRGFLGQ